MAADTSLLMGEVIENPEGQQRDIEHLLVQLLRSLLEEQKTQQTTSSHSGTPLNKEAP